MNWTQKYQQWIFAHCRSWVSFGTVPQDNFRVLLWILYLFEDECVGRNAIFVEMNINVDACDIPMTTAYFIDIVMTAVKILSLYMFPGFTKNDVRYMLSWTREIESYSRNPQLVPPGLLAKWIASNLGYL